MGSGISVGAALGSSAVESAITPIGKSRLIARRKVKAERSEVAK